MRMTRSGATPTPPRDVSRIRMLLGAGYDLEHITKSVNRANAYDHRFVPYRVSDVWDIIREHDLDCADRVMVPFRESEIEINIKE